MKHKKKRPRDISQLAASIVKESIGEDQPKNPITEKEKNPAAVALGRLGGLKGGKARAAKLSARKRKQIAQNAARKRWEKNQ
ncbi:MAG: hypothetical protein ACLP9S_18560 [Syntrophales bacterium]